MKEGNGVKGRGWGREVWVEKRSEGWETVKIKPRVKTNVDYQSCSKIAAKIGSRTLPVSADHSPSQVNDRIGLADCDDGTVLL